MQHRQKDIDYIRATAMVLVVIGHAITGGIRKGPGEVVFEIIYSFHMFVFFALSGYLFQKGFDSHAKDKKEYCLKRAVQLGIPYLTFTIIDYLIFGFAAKNTLLGGALGNKGSISVITFLKALFLNKNHVDTHLWYIYTLLIISIMSMIFDKATISTGFLAFCLIGNSFSDQLAGVPLFPAVIKWFIPFIIGRKVFDNRFELYLGLKKIPLAILLYIALMFSRYAITAVHPQNYFGVFVRRATLQNLNVVIGIIGSLAFINAIKVLSNNFTYALHYVELIARYSYDIYLFHQPFLVNGIITCVMFLLGNSFIAVCAAVIGGIVIPICICKNIIRKNRFLSLFFLGKLEKHTDNVLKN